MKRKTTPTIDCSLPNPFKDCTVSCLHSKKNHKILSDWGFQLPQLWLFDIRYFPFHSVFCYSLSGVQWHLNVKVWLSAKILMLYVCKVFCPEAGPSLNMHYQGSTYLSLLDKRKEWGSISSPFLTEPVALWEYLSLHTQTQECCKYNYWASPCPK